VLWAVIGNIIGKESNLPNQSEYIWSHLVTQLVSVLVWQRESIYAIWSYLVTNLFFKKSVSQKYAICLVSLKTFCISSHSSNLQANFLSIWNEHELQCVWCLTSFESFLLFLSQKQHCLRISCWQIWLGLTSSHEFHWRAYVYILEQHINSGTYKPLSNEGRTALEELMHLEMEFYQYIQKRFFQQASKVFLWKSRNVEISRINMTRSCQYQ